MFLLWDGDGEGTLSKDELLKAFIRIGLSQDHNFAEKIMYSIIDKRIVEAKGGEIEINIADFVKIFRSDDISDFAIKSINKEVNLRKKLKKEREVQK